MVTVTGPAGPSLTGSDQLQVPAALSCVTVPTSADRVVVPLPSASWNVPVFLRVLPSGPLTAGPSAATVGGELLGPTDRVPATSAVSSARTPAFLNNRKDNCASLRVGNAA